MTPTRSIRKLVPYAVVFAVALILGLWLRGDDTPPAAPDAAVEGAGHAGHAGMDDAESTAGPRRLRLTPEAEKLAEIQTQFVERKWVGAEVRMVGKVAFDETRLSYVTAYVPGRIDRLYVDFTGAVVHRGDHLVDLYSPELITAQEELRQSLRTVASLEKSDVTFLRERVAKTVETARDKLRLWGLNPQQIAEVEAGGEPREHMTIYSPLGGIVIHKNAQEGMYVQTGSRIYTLADLAHLWVELDAYESDLTWLRYAQPVRLEVEAFPGETFLGRISFIDPVLDPTTRTAKVRVNLGNPEGRLKPGMFVGAVVQPQLTADGRVTSSDLQGKWISPMHPEVLRDGPGRCPICGQKLVSAESLGYVKSEAKTEEPPLVIPASAPLLTGKRAVVYVQVPGEAGLYEGREVVLGPRSGDYYLVKEGLHEGERVVVNGSFKIDSALQIQAKPSMMNPEGGGQAPGHAHGGESG